MRDLTAIEIKAFVPAKDFELSKRFYQDLGFVVAWSSEGLAYIRHGNTSFLLQEFQEKAPDNFMMHLLVQDVDSWWELFDEFSFSSHPCTGCSTVEPFAPS
jgi:catechol 2,3-dioxygenase-like lactoylglutathione lyase family enzyme